MGYGIAGRQWVLVEKKPAPIGLNDGFPSQAEPIEMRFVDVEKSEGAAGLRQPLAVVDVLQGEPQFSMPGVRRSISVVSCTGSFGCPATLRKICQP